MTDHDDRQVDNIEPPTTGRIFMSAEYGTVHVPEGGTPPDWAQQTPPATLERPSTSDSKAVWVAFAGSVGIEQPDTLSKAELIDSTKEQGN